MRIWTRDDATNPAYGEEMTVTPPVFGSILVTPPASEKLIHHTDPWPYPIDPNKSKHKFL